MSDDSPEIIIYGFIGAMEAGGGIGGSGGSQPPAYGDSETAEGGTRFVGNLDPWYPPEGPDELEMRIDLNVARLLTSAELRAFEQFVNTVEKATETINNLPGSAKMRLADGKIVTGSELKEIWAKTDFKIDDVGETYANGSNRGEADYNNGDPEVSSPLQICSRILSLVGQGHLST